VKQIKEDLRRVEQAQQQAKEESAGFVQIIKWIVLMTGVGGLVFIFYNPVRNLIQRVLFKTFSYKSRRFDKEK
jgi:hypothetical protein